MNQQLKIECKWLGRQTGSAMERSFYADIGLAVGRDWLTLLEDLEASTVRNHLRGCGYQMATWFAANWWRLRWEPETRDWSKDVGWRVAHSLAGAGGGYVWPNVVFASDGDSLAVASLARPRAASFEPVRYLNQVLVRITAGEFERKVDALLEAILSRLDSRGVDNTELSALWTEVLAERHDVNATNRRKLEAMAGFDPDDASDVLIQELLQDQDRFGKSAVEEVTALARHSVREILEPIRELATRLGGPDTGGFRLSLPELDVPPSFGDQFARPWQTAAALARLARHEWGLGDKPIKNHRLADILGTTPSAFTDHSGAGTPIPFAVRRGANGLMDVYLNSRNSTTRRFAVCRMLGDHLYFSEKERLLPATHAKTSRQKFQRAFAQEFLCPIHALMEKLPIDEPDEDSVAEAAAYFHVSPLLVKTTLVNKGELDRDALKSTD
jgi:hypothetical protein